MKPDTAAMRRAVTAALEEDLGDRGDVTTSTVVPPERRLVGSVRDGIEVLLPLVGAVVLVVSVWISVS